MSNHNDIRHIKHYNSELALRNSFLQRIDLDPIVEPSYLKCGLYAGMKCGVNKDLDWEDGTIRKHWKVFPNIVAGGAELLNPQSEFNDFKLPYELYAFHELDKFVKKAKSDNDISQPTPFHIIGKNIWLTSFRPQPQDPCNCIPPDDENEMGCGAECVNRAMFIECLDTQCECGKQCSNNVIKLGKSAKVGIKFYGPQGWGVVAEEFIKKDSFVIEYKGEVIDDKMVKSRLKKYRGHRHYYLLNMGNDLTIDATIYGALPRYINHSCDPSCRTEKWFVRGRPTMGIFALRDIRPGDEITFDYRFKRIGGRKQECHCGTALCRGFLGAGAKRKTLNITATEDLFGQEKVKRSKYNSYLRRNVIKGRKIRYQMITNHFKSFEKEVEPFLHTKYPSILCDKTMKNQIIFKERPNVSANDLVDRLNTTLEQRNDSNNEISDEINVKHEKPKTKNYKKKKSRKQTNIKAERKMKSDVDLQVENSGVNHKYEKHAKVFGFWKETNTYYPATIATRHKNGEYTLYSEEENNQWRCKEHEIKLNMDQDNNK